ncbi:MAG: DUF3570 domain-containing protein [Deltaproteobacteria bacterium]|nr:DUF3570 domain-containing protein [Deltaproteobacteria bacterium]
MQLKLAALALLLAAGTRTAVAEDRTEVSTMLFAEKRDGDKGGLIVVHPQASFGVDIGRFVSFDVGYAADAVSGATSTVYQVDAVSTATKFSDLRNEGTIALGFRGRRSRITFATTVGSERDYVNRAFSGTASIDLPGRNTTIALAYSHSFDQVCNKNNAMATPLEARALVGTDPCNKTGLIFGKNDPMGRTVWEDLGIDTAQATITQNLSPTLNMQLAGYGQVLDGFQSNPYRRVRIGPNAPQEHIPDIRARWSVSARFNRYLPKLKSAVHFDARFYDDTWRVIGGNLELGYSQYVGKSLLLRFYGRIYQQTAAKFFKDAFYYQTQSTAGEYFTGDRELSPVRNVSVGTKLTLITIGNEKPVWGLFDKLQFNLRGDLMFISNLAADDEANNAGGIDKQFIYGTSLIDAVTLQLGLLGNY